jgi:hypothetical protein
MALLGAVASTLRRLEVYHHHNWRQYVISWGNMYNDKVRIALVCHGSLTGVSIYRVGDFGPPDRHLISQDKIRLRKPQLHMMLHPAHCFERGEDAERSNGALFFRV